MTLLIAPASIADLFEATIVLLVDERLQNAVPEWARHAATMIAFSGERIGPGNDHVELMSTGLPAAPMLVIEMPDSVLGRELSEGARQIGLAQPVELCRVPDATAAAAQIDTFVREALSRRSSLLAQRLAAREAELIALRSHLASVNSKLLRIEDAMSLAGFVKDEVVIAGQFPPPSANGMPIRADGYSRLVIRRSSADIKTVIVSFQTTTRTVAKTIAQFGEQGDSVEVHLPPEILALAGDVTVSAQPLLATTAGVGPAAPGSVELRLERPGILDAPPAGRPVLNLAIEEGADLPVTRLLPLLPRRQTLATGVWLSSSDRISLAGRLYGTAPRSARLEAMEHGGSGPAAFAMEGTIAGNAIAFEGDVGRAGRFDLIVVTIGGPTTVGKAVWGPPLIAGPTLPTSFASARFTALSHIISYCDGNDAELEENRQQGYAVMSVSDGAGYLQTHPIAGKTSGARLPGVIPAGTSRLWLEVENAHREAGATEFLAAIVPEPLEMPVADWLASLSLPAYEAVSITERQETMVARRVLRGATRVTLDLAFSAPRASVGSLYCLVRPLTRNTAYGWCRWHRMLVGVPASHKLDFPGR